MVQKLLNRNINLMVILICLCLISCDSDFKSSPNSKAYDLVCIKHSIKYQQPISLTIDDSLEFINLNMSYLVNNKKEVRIRTLKKINGVYYELKLNTHFNDNNVDSIYTLALSLKDTSYKYIFDEEKYTPSMPKGYDEWQYTIKKINNNKYSLTKRHLRDLTIKEEYFYDKNFLFTDINMYRASDTLIFSSK